VGDLALLDQLGHGTDGLLDRDLGIDAVLVVEVDLLDAEAPQRVLAALAHVLGVTTDPEALAVLAADAAELGRQDDLVAAPGDRRATSFSFVKGPYMSAVSRKVTPRSRARLITSRASPSSADP
jgi:hypothetical protein